MSAGQDSAAREAQRIQHEHSDVTGGWLRPAVFGASDGLVSNFALIAGVAGGTSDSTRCCSPGWPGSLPAPSRWRRGSTSRCARRPSRPCTRSRPSGGRSPATPRGEEFELAQMYVAKGLEPDLAREVARELSATPSGRSDVHVREELGLSVGRPALGDAGRRLVVRRPSPSARCCRSCRTCSGRPSLWPAAVLTVLGLFLCGAFVTRLTPRPWWYGGSRQVLVGAVAAAVTYGCRLPRRRPACG